MNYLEYSTYTKTFLVSPMYKRNLFSQMADLLMFTPLKKKLTAFLVFIIFVKRKF